MNRIVLGLLFTSIALLGFSQDRSKWNLKQCIEHAWQENVQIKQAGLQGDILSNNLEAAKMSRYPTLNANANHNYNIGRSIDPFTNTFDNQTIQSNSFSLSSGVLLFGGNQVNNTIKQSAKATEVNKEGIEVLKNQIALSVANAFLQIVQGEENLKIATAQSELTTKQLEQANKRVAAGAANKSISLNLEAQKANDRMQVVAAQNTIQMGYNILLNLLQIPNSQAFEIELPSMGSMPAMPSESVAQIYELALKNLPEVKQATLQIEQSELGEKISSASIQPRLTAFGNVNSVYSQSGRTAELLGFTPVEIGITETSNEIVYGAAPEYAYAVKPFGNQLKDNLGQQVGLALQVPIFNGGRNKASIENAKINTQISELNLASTNNQLRADVATAYTALTAAKERLSAAEASVVANETNYNFTKARFDAGAANSLELLNAKNTWNQALLNVSNSKYEYVFRHIIIEFYKGNPLNL